MIKSSLTRMRGWGHLVGSGSVSIHTNTSEHETFCWKKELCENRSTGAAHDAEITLQTLQQRITGEAPIVLI